MADQLPLLLRAVAISLALVLALASLGLAGRARRALLPMLLCLVAYVIRSAPELDAAPKLVLVPLAVGALLFPAAFWWLVHNSFEDRSDIPWPAWLVGGVLLAAGLSAETSDAAHRLQKAAAAAFVFAALWRLWVTRNQDLVSGRRVLRVWLLAYVGVHGLVVLAVELGLRGSTAPTWLDALNVAVITLALAVGLAFLVRFQPAAVETLFGTPGEPAALVAAPAQTHGLDTEWVDRLQRLMAVEAVYRDPELSLASLAQRLGLPEYRLRELINRRLGHRNFPAFVNDHRLREVEQKLADPAFDRRPILTLALEAGFGSIGPFNRAFRDRHGVTPTAFRNRRSSVPLAG
jgi:AraC-like DNA-binding protein